MNLSYPTHAPIIALALKLELLTLFFPCKAKLQLLTSALERTAIFRHNTLYTFTSFLLFNHLWKRSIRDTGTKINDAEIQGVLD